MVDAVLLCLAAALAAIALGALLARSRPARSLYSLTLAAFSPWSVLLALLATVGVGIVGGPPGLVGFGVTLACVVGHLVPRLPSHRATPTPRGAQALTAMTSNLWLGRADPTRLVDTVARYGVDVLMLQELTPQAEDDLVAAGLSAVLPHRVSDPRAGGAGTGLWSRHPLSAGVVDRSLGFSMVTARVQCPDTETPVIAVALHIRGPRPNSEFRHWRANMDALPAVLRAQPRGVAVLVGGDFNATPDVVQFRRLLTDGYADAARQAGAGLPRTYPAGRRYPAVIAIDHILTRDAVASSVGTVELSGSDHRGLVATVVVPDREVPVRTRDRRAR